MAYDRVMQKTHREAFETNRSLDRKIVEKVPRIELLDPAVVEVLRRKTPMERLAMVFAANRTMRLRIEGHLRSCHPEWDDQTLMQEIARRMCRGTARAASSRRRDP